MDFEFSSICSLIDNACPIKSDAVVILEGDGLVRFAPAINLFKEGIAKNIVFSGGVDSREKGCYNFLSSKYLFSEENIPANKLFVDDLSMHTRDQAVNIVGLAIKKQWKSVILVASHFHQYRAYLTFLKVLQETNNENTILLHNAPVRHLDWFKDTGWGKRYDLLISEFKKIITYRNDYGHIPSYDSFLQYMVWRESQLY